MKWTKPIYGRAIQYAKVESTLPVLNSKDTRRVQSKVGTFLYYGRAVDPTILVTLNEIGSSQSKPTDENEDQLDISMDYLHTYQNGVLRYQSGTMKLKVESDASYLSVRGAKSRIAGHFYLEASKGNRIRNTENAPILTECSILKNVVCSAAEAEC